MIVRIMGEGQYELATGSVEAGDPEEFAGAFADLLAAVREQGAAVADDALVESDLVLPPADATVDEVAELLGDEGLVPG